VDRDVGGFCALKNLIDLMGRVSKEVLILAGIGHEPTCGHVPTVWVDRRQPITSSAPARCVCGMMSPSAFAVCRLTMSFLTAHTRLTHASDAI
jgi:hypothetical protein